MTATAVGSVPPSHAVRGSAHLAGTATLLRLIARRERFRTPAWIVGIAGVMLAGAAAYPGLYPTAAERQAQAAIFDSNPAMKAMAGPGHGIENYTFGAMMTNEYLGIMVVAVALMSIFLVVRHTRAEEEDGRAELVRAHPTGSAAPLTAALVATAVANVVLGAIVAVGLASLGIETIDWPGSLLFGAAFTAVGLVFAGVAAVTSQLTQYSRAASGLAGAILGAAYLLRAVGDVMDNGLSWLSPVGWAQATAAYVDDSWAPIALALVATVLLAHLAFRLAARRDLGAGLRAERQGAAYGSAFLGTPLGLAWRLQRSSLLWWAGAMVLIGAVYGSAMNVIEDYADNEVVARMMESLGGTTLTEAYLSMILSLLAIVVAIFAITTALRPRREETSGRSDGVLATGVSRVRWYAAHLVIALVGSLVVLLLAGLGLGLAAYAVTGDGGVVGQAVGAIATYTPAVWVMAGVAVVAVGWAPRATTVAWLVVAFAFFIVYLGGLLGLPDWLVNLSPFSHVPPMPAESFSGMPLAWLTLVAAVLVGVGLAGFGRRDLDTA